MFLAYEPDIVTRLQASPNQHSRVNQRRSMMQNMQNMQNIQSRNRTLDNNNSSLSVKGARRSKIFPYEDSLEISEARKKQETLEDILLGNISQIYQSRDRNLIDNQQVPEFNFEQSKGLVEGRCVTDLSLNFNSISPRKDIQDIV